MSDKIIEMTNIIKSYDGKRNVLDNLEFTAHKGEFIAIKGKSGTGKSTLLNILGLLDTFNSGSYILNNEKILSKKYNTYNQLRSKYIGFIFQSYHLIDSISIEDNILIPYLYSNQPINKSVKNRIEFILEDFKLNELKSKKVSLLSGGEKQRVAIARAIIKSPQIIIADEPTGNLDDENSNIVMGALKKCADQSTTVILVTHDTKLLSYGDSTYNLSEGKLIKYEIQ